MAWNDALETVVGSSGQVYTAVTGTALPTTARASLNAAFEGLGYHTEDGVTVNKPFEITEFRAWQTRRPIRRERQAEDFELSFTLIQWNEVTLPFVFGGGEVVSDGSTGYRFNPPADGDAIDERSVIVDVDDGDSRRLRFVIPRGTVTETAESQFQRTELGTLRVTFRSLEPAEGGDSWYMLTDDAAAFAAGS